MRSAVVLDAGRGVLCGGLAEGGGRNSLVPVREALTRLLAIDETRTVGDVDSAAGTAGEGR